MKINPSPRAKREVIENGAKCENATRKLFGTEIDQNIMEIS